MDLKKKILDEAKKKGFLLEIDVQNLFDKRGWFTRPNVRIITQDGEIEMDLLTNKSISDKKGNFNSAKVICSCKKSEEHPWVFYLIKRAFGDRLPIVSKFTSTNESVGNSNFVTPAKIYWLNEEIDISDLKINNFKIRGKTYYLAFCDSKSKKGRQIYDAVQGVIGFLKYELAKNRETNKSLTSQNITQIYFPLIVLDGKLFGVENRNGKVIINEMEYIPLIIETGDPNLDKLLIHVVKKDNLDNFVEMIEKDFKLFNNKVNNFLKKSKSK